MGFHPLAVNRAIALLPSLTVMAPPLPLMLLLLLPPAAAPRLLPPPSFIMSRGLIVTVVPVLVPLLVVAAPAVAAGLALALALAPLLLPWCRFEDELTVGERTVDPD